MNNQAELISIGNELLSGRTLNTHGKDLGGALAEIGLQLMRDGAPDPRGAVLAQPFSLASASSSSGGSKQ